MHHAPARLWLLRHAQPLIAPGICYGRLDVPANAAFTQKAAQTMVAHLGHSMIVVRYSPSRRCASLAAALQSAAPEQVTGMVADGRLQEMDFGRWEGCAWDAIACADIHAWANDLPHYTPPGGEALGTMLQRVRMALCESWRADSQYGRHDVLWVTHAGTIRCVQWLLQHYPSLPNSEQWNLPAPIFGAWLTQTWADAMTIGPCLNP